MKSLYNILLVTNIEHGQVDTIKYSYVLWVAYAWDYSGAYCSPYSRCVLDQHDIGYMTERFIINRTEFFH